MIKRLIMVAALFLSACAQSGVPYSKAISELPPLAADEARLFIYRDSLKGALTQPSIFLDGIKIGNSVSGSFIAIRLKAGEHKLSAQTETESVMKIDAKPGDEIYVKTNMNIGLFLGHVEFVRVMPEQGRNDMKDLLKQERLK